MLPKTFRQAPFLRIVLFYIIGVIAQYNYDIASWKRYLLALTLILLLFCCFSKIKRRYNPIDLFGCGVFLLSFVCAVYMTEKAWKKSDWNVDGTHSYLIRVMDKPINKAKTRMCKADIISSDSMIQEKVVNKTVIVYLPKDSLSATIVPGNCLYIRASLEKPYSLPGETSFDYPLYLRKQSCSAIAFVRKQDWQMINIPIPKRQWLYFRSFGLRENLFSRLQAILPDSRSFSMAAALMFGHKNELDNDLRRNFSNIGAGHILAVSGLHFNLIFGFAYLLLSFIGMSRQGRMAKQLILLPAIWIFAFLTGLSPSVIRAACMLSFWGIGNALFYKSFSLNTLSAVAFFMLLYNPLYLFDIGFQLSFLAVVSILILNPSIVHLYSSANKIIMYLWELVSVSFSAQVGVLPLSLYYFRQFPLLFLLSNMILVPLSGILMILIPFSLLLHWLAGNQEWMFFPLRFLMSGFISITESLGNIPGGSISNINLSVSSTFLIYVGLAGIVYLLLRKKAVTKVDLK
ncbi:MAG: ComEC family competence protein [Dysgonamonadaceae bacterium]|jgi:competence protein ComEC|nr:ComEC family competence protein [Dysgonamonadaceae bacterium]